MKKSKKTNVIRILEKNKIPYEHVSYPVDPDDLSGIHAAEIMDEDPDQVFKTLVLEGRKNGYFVCVIPVAKEVDLKKAAKAFEDKKADLIALKDLLPITGYMRGGCSPIGMKKAFPVFLDRSAQDFERIGISAGQRGEQIFVSPDDLLVITKGQLADLTQ